MLYRFQFAKSSSGNDRIIKSDNAVGRVITRTFEMKYFQWFELLPTHKRLTYQTINSQVINFYRIRFVQCAALPTDILVSSESRDEDEAT